MEGFATSSALDEARLRFADQRRRFWNEFAANLEHWDSFRALYQQRLSEVYRFLIPPGARILEIGCGRGDLLASLQPAIGVGVDFSEAMVQKARKAHPGLQFVEADALEFRIGQPFDYIICSDLVNDLWDIQQLFDRIRDHSQPESRVILNYYNNLWELPRRAAELLGVARRLLPQNWVTRQDLHHIAYLAGFEVIRNFTEVLWPFRTPVLATMANRYVVKLWPVHRFGITNFLVARLAAKPRPGPAPIVSVAVPARNEEGNISRIFSRVPRMGARTELIFVEGGSTDNTYATIEAEIAKHPEVDAHLFRQPGTGKGDAVRKGFAEATGDLLMILDADLTVAPEDLPRFYEAWRSGKADLVNGVRLIYPLEKRAMRAFNKLGNKFFSFAFTWLLGQPIRDTLCGTKVLSRQHYRLIAEHRSDFGEFDPFGDFDLLFGAARYSLRIVDLPIRYRERTHGKTNIQRWRHGLILFAMVAFALRKIKFT